MRSFSRMCRQIEEVFLWIGSQQYLRSKQMELCRLSRTMRSGIATAKAPAASKKFNGCLHCFYMPKHVMLAYCSRITCESIQ
jgi:hypothetical protein